MAQREWVEKDFYKELGVSSDASQKRSRRAYRKLLATCIRTQSRQPRRRAKYKAVSEAHNVLSDRPSARSTTRPGGCSPAAASVAAGSTPVASAVRVGGDGAEFNLNDLFDAAGRTGGANIGDLFGGLFGRGAGPVPAGPGAATTWRPRPSWISSRPPRAWQCRCG